jgi:hypothetical protein
MSGRTLALAAVLLALAPSQLAAATPVTPEESRVLDRWAIQVGGFATGLNTKIRFDEVIGNRGTTVNLEEDLGFDDNDVVLQLSASRIIGRRHMVHLNYFEIDRDGFTTLDREIEWGDETLELGAEVVSRYQTEFIGLSYTYWVRSREKSAWGPFVGLVSFSTATEVGVEGRGGIGLSTAGEFDVDVPVVQVGLRYRQYLGKKWRFACQGGFVAFDDIDDFSGDVISATVAFEHQTWEKFAFGLGYGLRDFDIDSGEKRALGNFTYEIRGFYFYGQVGF